MSLDTLLDREAVCLNPSIEGHDYNPSTHGEAEGFLWVQGQLGFHSKSEASKHTRVE